MDFKLFSVLSKFPFLDENGFYNGIELRQNKTCEDKCKEKDCSILLTKHLNFEEYICSKGYNNLLICLNDFKVVLNGLIFKDNTTVPAGRKEVRKDWMIEKESVLMFANKVNEIEEQIINKINESIESNFSIFHDFKTSMSIFFNCTQDIINQLPGGTFEEKLLNSDKIYKDLYNSLELIDSQLQMVDVILNPRSISFGSRREINMFKLFYKLKVLFEHISSKTKSINFELTNVDGAYIRNCNCYDSIEFIPLILLDNALKYSAPNSTVKIEITQLYNKAKIKVKNIGPLVCDKNKDKIFEKFFRDESAQEFSKNGIGMGLWIAQKILEAHGTKLAYNKDPHAIGKIGLNIFEFEIATN
jgi:K+-sensing histidine kinase KdpD